MYNPFYHVDVVLKFILLCFGLQVHLYQKIREANITYVSIGHRSSLYGYHDRILRISTFDSNNEQPNWCIEPTRPESSLKFTNLWACSAYHLKKYMVQLHWTIILLYMMLRC